MSKCIKCGSYAFNLYKEDIDKGGLCDVHYWQSRAHRAEALAEHPAQGCDHCNHALYSGTKCKNCGRVTEQAAIKRDLTPEQQAQQEPIAYAVYHRMGGSKSLHWSEQHSPDGDASQYQLLPLYTSSQAERPWVGLTKHEFNECVDGLEDLEDCWTAIEAKLKEKNT